MGDDANDDASWPPEFSRRWRPAERKGKRRIDSYDPAAFGIRPPEINDVIVDRIVEATEPDFEVRPRERAALRERLTEILMNFDTLRISQERPSPSEYSERLKAVETAARKLLSTLGVAAEPGPLVERDVLAIELNPNISGALASVAGKDVSVISSCATAVACLAAWSAAAQPGLKASREVDFARIFAIQELANTFREVFEMEPTSTRDGAFLRFLRAVLETAGEQSTTLTDDALKNAWDLARKRSPRQTG